MHYLKVSSWIFVLLVLLIALLILYPTATMIWLAVIGLHGLIALQVILVLKADTKSEHTFSDRWYDEH